MRQWGICMRGNEKKIAAAVLDVAFDYPFEQEFVYVEIGAAMGGTFSAVCELMDMTLPNWKAVAIDIRNGWSLGLKKLTSSTAKFRENVLISLDGSPKAFENFPFDHIDIAFIDGDHSKDAAKLDFNTVDKLLVKGGIAIFHDTDVNSQGLDIQPSTGLAIQVRRACQELGLLDGSNTAYELITDYPGEAHLDSRGIIIVRKKLSGAT